MNKAHSIIRITAISAILGLMSLSARAESADSIADKGNIVSRVIDYFDKSNKREIGKRPNFTLLGGPHYSSEKGIGLGLVVAGNYSTSPGDSSVYVSNVSIVGDVGTKGYYSVGVRGNHIFPRNARRINYGIDFQSFSTYFWGIGYDLAKNDANKTKYQLFDIKFNADYEWLTAPGLYIGPVIETGYSLASDAADYSLWDRQPHHIFNFSLGAYLIYDLRDNLTYPRKGLTIEMSQLISPKALGNGNHHFSKTEISMNYYHTIWKSGVLATRFHSVWTYGNTPWSKLPVLGGRSMRAYYVGRYRDKCASDLTVELRQHLFRRSGLALWCGAGVIYHNISGLKIKNFLPETGIGYRWEFKKDSNVRVDFGIGRHSTGFILGLNESF